MTLIGSPSPKRIQRSRLKGWRMPEDAVYVGRPTQWGNAYLMSSEADRDASVAWYRHYIERLLEQAPDMLEQLRGKDLACWCSLSKPCHADVLLELANRPYSIVVATLDGVG